MAEGARIGARTIVHPHVTIGRFAEIGEDCVIHARVSIRDRVRVGHRVVLQDGVVLGADGFGFAHRRDGTHEKIPQIGGLVVEDDVEIGANSTVDRPAVGDTRIGAGTKIDNLVQIAHGVRLGRNVLLAAQVGIAGSTVIEDGVTLAGQVGVAGHLTIGKGVIATAQSGIPNSVEARRLHLRLSGHSQSRLAEIVGGLPQAARAPQAACRPRTAHRGAGSRGRREGLTFGSSAIIEVP